MYVHIYATKNISDIHINKQNEMLAMETPG